MEYIRPIKIIYTTYTPSQERAIKKYQAKNKESLAKKQKEKYDLMKNDPVHMAKLRARSKEYYHRRKALIPFMMV